MFEERLYREEMGGDFDVFVLAIEETDLWIALSKGFYSENIKDELEKYLILERNNLKKYIKLDPEFETSLVPYKASEFAPGIVKKMSELSFSSNVGPMAGVAGAFSLLAGKFLKEKNIPEIIVENGGDIFVYGFKYLKLGIFAGLSPFTNKIKIEVDLNKKEFGICSSSGSFGHSLSFGKADLVTIIAEDIVIADLFATETCNKIKCKDDVEKVINELKNIKELSGALIILEDKLGAFGNFKILGRN